MQSPTGRLLDRHYHAAVDCAIPGGCRAVSLPSSAYDPLSKDFIVPPDVLPNPRDLVRFFEARVWRKFNREGRRWGLPRSRQSYLRSAKSLLDYAGLEMAVRAICHGVGVSNHCPSFKFISSVVPQIQESLQRCDTSTLSS